MTGSSPRGRAILALAVIVLLAGCAGMIGGGGDDTETPDPTSSADVAPVEDENVSTGSTEVERLESFVAMLERKGVAVVDYGFADEGFVGLVYRHDEATAETDFDAVVEGYSSIASSDPWSPEELRVMTVDGDGEPLTTYRVRSEDANAYANKSITREEYEGHIEDTYEVVVEDAPTPTPVDDIEFTFPDDADGAEELPEATPGGTPPVDATPTPTSTPEDDDGWLIFEDG